MNILIFSWRGIGHPNAGGAEIATHEHAKAWVRAGHSVTLFTSSYKDRKNLEVIDGVQIVRMGNQFLAVHVCAVIWYILFRHPKFDIVVDQFHGIPFFTPIFVKSKILAYIHEVASQVWSKNEFTRPLNYFTALIGPRVEPFIFKMYRNIDFMTVSDSTKRDLIKFGINKSRINVILNGVTTLKVSGIRHEKLITYLGSLSKDKGIEDAIDIFLEVIRKDDGWKMSVVGRGNGDYVEYLKDKVNNAGVSSLVKFEGYVPQRKKYEILAKSFCIVNPSIHEGWGLVNIEANSMGAPVIAYKVKGITDSVVDGKTGYLVEGGDFHQAALEIIKLANDKKRYDSVSGYCIKWSKKFTWEKSTTESIKLVESL